MDTKFRFFAAAACLVLGLAGCRGATEDAQPPPAAAGPQTPDIGHITGLQDAPVTVIEFSDFGCPYCAQFALSTYPELHTEFVLSGQVRWIFVPFVIGRFPNGYGAALSGECAAEQGRFWPMHDNLFTHQSEWRRTGPAEEVFFSLAEDAGVDIERFEECYRENRPAARIDRHNALAQEVKVRGTPSFLVNGRPVEGALPIGTFRSVLEQALINAR